MLSTLKVVQYLIGQLMSSKKKKNYSFFCLEDTTGPKETTLTISSQMSQFPKHLTWPHSNAPHCKGFQVFNSDRFWKVLVSLTPSLSFLPSRTKMPSYIKTIPTPPTLRPSYSLS